MRILIMTGWLVLVSVAAYCVEKVLSPDMHDIAFSQAELTTKWVGPEMAFYETDPEFWDDLPMYKFGLRSDGVVVWREVEE